MANYEINEEQEVLTKAMRMIETGDPVHADIYNALFSALLNNDVFLEKLANKMVQQAMVSHVMDSTNSNMVLGADQGPVITKLIDKVQEQVTVLNTKSQFTGYVASTSCNYSGGTADFVIDISKLPLKRAGFLIICTSSTWAEVYLLVVNAQELKTEQNTSGLTVIKIYNTYDKFEFKANAHEGNSNHVRINVKNTAGEACMVSALAPYQS